LPYLTCFDWLGQPTGWVDFERWLREKPEQGAAIERQEALQKFPPSTNPIDAALALYSAYNDKYGVRRAFFRFLNDVLPPDERSALASSMKLIIQKWGRNASKSELHDDKKKELFLWNVRNAYTHRARAVWGVAPPFNRAEDGFVFYGTDYCGSSKSKDLWVRDWPSALRRAVCAGLGSYVHALRGARADAGPAR
jgi:hypothetical protein